LKIIGPLTDPTSFGGTPEDAFDVVIPSGAGYGFSGKPTTPGWDPAHMARAWTVLMKRLGYTRFVAQGGDWGAFVTNELAQQAPPELMAIHVNFPVLSSRTYPMLVSVDRRARPCREACRRRYRRGGGRG